MVRGAQGCERGHEQVRIREARRQGLLRESGVTGADRTSGLAGGLVGMLFATVLLTAVDPFTLIVLVLVVVVKELLGRFLLREGRDLHSRAVETDAWHHRSDAFTSIAAFIGISLALWQGQAWAAADDWAALFACAIIGYNGVHLFRGALDDLLDAAQPPIIETRIREMATSVPGVVGTHNLRVRRSGMFLLVDLDVIVDGDMSVRHGHEIAHDVKEVLLASDLRVLNVLVHVEPAEEVRA